ncbi:MAG: hypothetical protein RR716_07860 [Christensenellaceae bacterium]
MLDRQQQNNKTDSFKNTFGGYTMPKVFFGSISNVASGAVNESRELGLIRVN